MGKMFASLSRAVFVFIVFEKLNYGTADLCSSPPPLINPHDCCDFPFLFDKSILDECGVDLDVKSDFDPSSCDNIACVFKKQNIISDDRKINKEMAKAYINKWSISHPEWADSNGEVTEKCLSDAYLQSGPPDMCQPLKVTLCFSKILFLSCPAKYWTSSDQCENVKTYLQQCRSH